MREYSFEITKKRYDYLLPVFGNCGNRKLLCRVDRQIEKYYFIGTNEDFEDLLVRCKYI
jgi:hypothetical protein